MEHRLLLLSKNPTVTLAVSEVVATQNFHLTCFSDQDLAWSAAQQSKPDLILWESSERNDNAFIVGLRSHPTLFHVPVIRLSPCNAWVDRVEALRSGIDVLVGMPFSAGELLAVIAALLDQANRLHQDSASSEGEVSPPQKDVLFLTRSEQRVLNYVSQGEHNKFIARILNSSQRTVETHITSMLNKTGFKNRTQLARWFLQMPNQFAPARP